MKIIFDDDNCTILIQAKNEETARNIESDIWHYCIDTNISGNVNHLWTINEYFTMKVSMDDEWYSFKEQIEKIVEGNV